jgi:tetratricopeptide (TPR) repeat protein
MNKENFLFGIIGLLLGLIVGFMFANSVNQSAVKPVVATGTSPSGASPSGSIPPGHPDIGSTSSSSSALTSSSGGMQPEVQSAIADAKAKPNDFDAQIKAAEMYYQIQRFEGAIEFLKQANKLKPDDYDTVVNLGNSYFDAGQYAEAEKWYTAALAKKSDDVNVRTDLGLTFIFRESPNYDRAIQEFTKSLELDPNHVQTLQNLTVAYTKKGDAAKANETLARMESINSSNPAIAKLREDIQKLESK